MKVDRSPSRRARRYCSRECQVSHFPDHKKACKAAGKRHGSRTARLRFPIGSWVLVHIQLNRGERSWTPGVVIAHNLSDACYRVCFFSGAPMPGYDPLPSHLDQQPVLAPQDTDQYIRALPEVSLHEFYEARWRACSSVPGFPADPRGNDYEWSTKRLQPGETASPTVVCLASLLTLRAHEQDLVEFSCIARGMLGTDVGRAVARFKRGEGSTLLYMASKYLRPAHVEVLLDMGAGAVIDQQTTEGNSALAIAARRPSFAITKRLLAAGANPHLMGDFGAMLIRGRTVPVQYTALACAVRSGFRDIVELLLEQPISDEGKLVEERALLAVMANIDSERRTHRQESRETRRVNKLNESTALELVLEIRARDDWFTHRIYDRVFTGAGTMAELPMLVILRDGLPRE
mmetsp:Transcript_32013/g.98809  ORF Transcript_32013/g.98809 Transcript_32013/m.98809 type:complete len:404 (-) Transcript_32013:39-1250(-)